MAADIFYYKDQWPCFSRLASWLQSSNREVKQVCFNAGDSWYAAKETALHYTGSVKKFCLLAARVT